MSSADLAGFLLARIEEDEAVARAASFQVHEWLPGDDAVREAISFGFHPVADVYDCREVADHIARFDPARVLAECEAKRRIIAAAGPTDTWESDYAQGIDHAIRCLASVYSSHPDYREEWRP